MSTVINAAEFDSKVRNASGKVLVDFFATWCGPCKMLAPVIDEISAEKPDVAVYKVDIDQRPDLAREYGVAGVPTVYVFEDGKPVNKAVGVQPKQNILNMLA